MYNYGYNNQKIIYVTNLKLITELVVIQFVINFFL